jgi:acetyl-CoA C-acetyltransferase
MKKVYVVEALRTPFGSMGGSLSDVPAIDLAASVITKIMETHALPADAIDEVIIGQVLQGGASQAPARQAMRKAGLDDGTHAMTINKVCGSGLKSLMLGAQSIMTEDSDLVIAGGMENMSLAPYVLPNGRYGHRLGDGKIFDVMMLDGLTDPNSGSPMGVLAEGSVEKYGLSREEQDDYAARSYKLSTKAVEEGLFEEEIVPVVKKTRKGEVVVAKDEEPFNGSVEKLPSLRAVFKKEGTITAGNASTINDGASILLLASEEAVQKYGLKPKAVFKSFGTNSIHPNDFCEAPVGAMEKAIAKAGLTKDDIDLFEINEAFSSVPLIAIKKMGLDAEKVNVNGGAVSLGHPIGASGARLVTTLIREMKARGSKYGVASLCIGGGEGVAGVFELI